MLRRRSGIAVSLITDLIGWEPDVIIQVGIGDIFDEVEVFKDAWPKAKLIGFEPNTSLRKLYAEKYYGEVREMALSDRVGTSTLYIKHRHKGGSSLYPFPEDQRVDKQATYVSTLDEQFRRGGALQQGQQHLLWVDCEGSELKVLQGGVETIQQHVQLINIEMTGKPQSVGWPSQLELHEYLMELGFLRQWSHTQRSSAGQNDAIYVRPHLFDPQYCNCPCQLKNWCGEK